MTGALCPSSLIAEGSQCTDLLWRALCCPQAEDIPECPWWAWPQCRPTEWSIPLYPYLVPAHSLLLDLLKFPLQLALALQPLLGSAHVHHPPVDLLPIHVGHRLPAEGRALSAAGSQRLYSSPTTPVHPYGEQRPPWRGQGSSSAPLCQVLPIQPPPQAQGW